MDTVTISITPTGAPTTNNKTLIIIGAVSAATAIIIGAIAVASSKSSNKTK